VQILFFCKSGLSVNYVRSGSDTITSPSGTGQTSAAGGGVQIGYLCVSDGTSIWYLTGLPVAG
jgi:hypothetical protein